MKKNWKEILKLWLGALLHLAESAAIGCKKLPKRAVALCLAAALVVAMVPAYVFAAETTYDIWVGGVQVTSANKDDITTAITAAGGTADGTATYDPESNTLTLNGFSYSGVGYQYFSDGRHAAIYSGSGLTIKLVGENTVTTTSTDKIGAGLYVTGGTLTITDDTTGNKADGKLVLTGKTYGLLADRLVTIQNVTVNSTGNSGIYGDQYVTIDNAKVTAKGSGNTNWDAGIFSSYDLTIRNSEITAEAEYSTAVYIRVSSMQLAIENSSLKITGNFGIKYGNGSGVVPTFTGDYVVYAGDDAGSATEADASADATYANKYVKIEPVCTVTANYGVDGVDNKEIAVTKGDTISLEKPIIDGYIFIGWYANADYTTAFDFDTPITAATTIYAKFADYEGDQAALKAAIDALEADVTELNKLTESGGTIAQIDAKISAIESQIAELDALKNKYAEADTALKQELQAADTAINNAIAALTGRVETLESELAAAKNDISANTSKVALLTAALADLETSLAELSSKLTNEYATKAELTSAINSAKDTINSAIDALTDRVQDLDAGLADVNSRVDTNTSDVGVLKSDVAALKTWKTEAQDAIAALETLTATQSADIARLKAAVQDLQAEVAAIKASIDDIEDRIEALEGKVDALQIAKQNLEAAVAALDAAVKDKADTATLNAKVSELNAAIAAAQETAKSYTDSKATELTAAIAAAKGEAVSTAEDLVTNAKAELQTAINNKADIVTLNEKVDQLNTAIATAEATAKAYTDQKVNDLTSAIATAKAEAVDAAKAMIDAAKDELQTAIDAKADAATVNAAVANLQNAITALETVKDNYITADTTLKAELEAAIAQAKQEAIDAAKGYIPYIGTNGNWWIGDTDTGVDANGIKGDTGNGIASITTQKVKGVTTVTITFTDATKDPVVFTVSDGSKGNTGADGVGIAKIEKTATEGNVDTYTITLTNGKTFTFTVTNGKDGKDGLVPSIGENGNWWVGDTDTGVKAAAEQTAQKGTDAIAVVSIVVACVALLSNLALVVWIIIKKK